MDALNTQTYARNVAKDQARVHNGNVHVQGDYYAAPMYQPSQEFEDCLKSLHFIEMQDLQTAPKTALVGTCSWVWEVGFREWLLEPKGAYWVQGTPGSGKTTLMGYLASKSGMQLQLHLRNMPAPLPPIVIATYYFQADHAHMARSLEGLLRSLIWQMAQQLSSATSLLTARYRKIKGFRSSFSWSLADLKGAFRNVVDGSIDAQFCIFVVGLDEHDGEDEVIASFLDDLTHSLPERVRFCLSSRPYPDFAYQFRTLTGFKMHEHIEGDIKTYVDHRFVEAYHLQYDSLPQLIQSIIDKASGSFLWVKLACDEMQRGWRRHRSFAELERSLDQMPKDLVPFYARILDTLEERDAQELARMLHIVVDAGRHLSVAEFCHAMDYGRPVHEHSMPDFLPFDLKSRLADCTEARLRVSYGPEFKSWWLDRPAIDAYCSLDTSGIICERIELASRGLLMVKPYDVRLSHETVLQFWLQRCRSHGHEAEGSEILLSACVSYIAILSRHMNCDTARTTTLIDLNTSYPFIKYAVTWLTQHGQHAERKSDTSQLQTMKQFIGQPLVFWQIVIRDKRLQVYRPALNLVEFCVEFYMHRTAFAVLSSKETLINTPYSKTPIERTHDLVLQNCVSGTSSYDINMNGGRLLLQASIYDSTTLLDELFSRGAILHQNLPMASMALHRAIYHGNMHFLRRFLEICSSVEPLRHLSYTSTPCCACCEIPVGGTFFQCVHCVPKGLFLCNHCVEDDLYHDPEHSFTKCLSVQVEQVERSFQADTADIRLVNMFDTYVLPQRDEQHAMVLGHFTLLCAPETFVWDRYWLRELLENNIVFSPLEFACALDRRDAIDELLNFYTRHSRLLGSISDAIVTASYYGRLGILKSLLASHVANEPSLLDDRPRSHQCMLDRGRRHSCHAIIAAVHGGFVDVLRELLRNPIMARDLTAHCKDHWITLLSCDIRASPLHIAIAEFRSRDEADSKAIIEILSAQRCTLSKSIRAVLPEMVEMQLLLPDDLKWVLRQLVWTDDESDHGFDAIVRPVRDDHQIGPSWLTGHDSLSDSTDRRRFALLIRSQSRLG